MCNCCLITQLIVNFFSILILMDKFMNNLYDAHLPRFKSFDNMHICLASNPLILYIYI